MRPQVGEHCVKDTKEEDNTACRLQDGNRNNFRVTAHAQLGRWPRVHAHLARV